MHGIGNDYIYFDCFEKELSDPSSISVRLSDRHFSVGGDGIVMICASSVADGTMRMFNADGSESAMCGNAIRCVAKFLYDRGIVRKEHMVIETLSGLKSLTLTVEGGVCIRAAVDMGYAVTDPERVPVLGFDSPVIGRFCGIGGYPCRA